MIGATHDRVQKQKEAKGIKTIGGPFGTSGRASVPQRLINQSLYQKILLLQKFNDIAQFSGKPLFFPVPVFTNFCIL